MFSLQTIFGSGNQFYTLLDEAAVAASDAAKALHSMLRDADRQPELDGGVGEAGRSARLPRGGLREDGEGIPNIDKQSFRAMKPP